MREALPGCKCYRSPELAAPVEPGTSRPSASARSACALAVAWSAATCAATAAALPPGPASPTRTAAAACLAVACSLAASASASCANAAAAAGSVAASSCASGSGRFTETAIHRLSTTSSQRALPAVGTGTEAESCDSRPRACALPQVRVHAVCLLSTLSALMTLLRRTSLYWKRPAAREARHAGKVRLPSGLVANQSTYAAGGRWRGASSTLSCLHNRAPSTHFHMTLGVVCCRDRPARGGGLQLHSPQEGPSMPKCCPPQRAHA